MKLNKKNLKNNNINHVLKGRAFIELTRADHGVMIIIAILIGAVIAGKSLPDIWKFVMASVAGSFLEMASFALNDYFDVEIDTANKRMDRPIVRGEIKKEHALYTYFILFPVGIAAALMVNISCFLIAVLALILSTIYDMKLKKIKFIGNFYIAFASSIPFIFGALTVREEIPSIIWVLFTMAFLASAGREIMKDVIDLEGDALSGVSSFASIIGKRAANYMASLFYISAILISLIPFFINFDPSYFNNLFYFITIWIPDAIFLYVVYILIKGNNDEIKKCRRYSLIAMLIAMLVMLVSAFI